MEPDLGELVRRALTEDAAHQDITTLATVPEGARGRGRLVAKQRCVVAGLSVFTLCFAELDPRVHVAEMRVTDGATVVAGNTLVVVEGPLRPILTAERTALNFVRHLSGVATLTRAFVRAAARRVEIRDTRKTTPGLRALEKAAVRAGGGKGHRVSLAEAILIKDNHILAAGGIEAAVKGARTARPGLPVEVECDTLDQVEQAIGAGADELLLDNMDPATLAEAVRLVGGRARTEASGTVGLQDVALVAATGVDSISIGALTHSAPAADLSLDVEVD